MNSVFIYHRYVCMKGMITIPYTSANMVLTSLDVKIMSVVILTSAMLHIVFRIEECVMEYMTVYMEMKIGRAS